MVPATKPPFKISLLTDFPCQMLTIAASEFSNKKIDWQNIKSNYELQQLQYRRDQENKT